MTSTYDVVVIGGGAAGLSAALVLGRARRRVLVVDAGEPRNAPAARMYGFLSRDGTPPADLLAEGRREVLRYGVELVDDRVAAADRDLTVHLASGATVTARRILIATGVTDELPSIRGAQERWGRDLLHCPYCHGWEVKDQPLGVLGTVPGSVDHAHLVRQWSDDVVFFAHAYNLTAEDRRSMDARGIRIVEGHVKGLVVADDRLTGVELADGTSVARNAVFVRTRHVPRAAGLCEAMGCVLTAEGLPAVDETGRTTVPAVWAVGNASDPRASVITSAGSGSAAAMAINADLVREDVLAAAAGVGASR